MKKIITLFIALALILGFAGSAFAATFETDLSYGSTGADVTALQQFLTKVEIYSGPVTGNFYSLTRQALIVFQTQQNIKPAAGYFGPVTRGIVNNILDGVDIIPADAEVSAQPDTKSLQAQIDALLDELAQVQTKLALQASTSQATSSTATSTATSTPSVPPANNGTSTVPEAQPLLDNPQDNMPKYSGDGQDNVDAWYFNADTNKPILNASATPDMVYNLKGQPRFANIPNKLNSLFSFLFGPSRAEQIIQNSTFDSLTVSAIPADQWAGQVSLADYATRIGSPVNYGLKLSFTKLGADGVTVFKYSDEFNRDFIQDNGEYPIITN